MASKKILKKDIDYLITEVILDCYACIEEHPERDLSAYEEIINEIIILKEEMIERINKFNRKADGNSRAYFRALKNDLILRITNSHQKLVDLGC